jgi:hypothetical protein
LEIIQKYLNGSAVGNDGSLDSFIPQALLGEVSEQVMIDNLELAGEHAASVDMLEVYGSMLSLLPRIWVVEAVSAYRGNQQRVRRNVLLDLFMKLGPIPQLGAGINTPHVKLQNLQNERENLLQPIYITSSNKVPFTGCWFFVIILSLKIINNLFCQKQVTETVF